VRDGAGHVPASSFRGAIGSVRAPCAAAHPFRPGDRLLPMDASFRAVLSPCIGVCTLGDDGLCHGCLRSGAEIARWMQMGDDERLRLMEQVLPERESRRR
jgi:uncharacterized protein